MTFLRNWILPRATQKCAGITQMVPDEPIQRLCTVCEAMAAYWLRFEPPVKHSENVIPSPETSNSLNPGGRGVGPQEPRESEDIQDPLFHFRCTLPGTH